MFIYKNKRNIGKIFEERACRYLESNGYQTIKTNFYSRYGEIDIICTRKNSLIFFEVKKRQNKDFGTSIEMVSPLKLKKIKKTIQYFLYLYPEYSDYYLRLDIIGFDNQKLTHIQNVSL